MSISMRVCVAVFVLRTLSVSPHPLTDSQKVLGGWHSHKRWLLRLGVCSFVCMCGFMEFCARIPIFWGGFASPMPCIYIYKVLYTNILVYNNSRGRTEMNSTLHIHYSLETLYHCMLSSGRFWWGFYTAWHRCAQATCIARVQTSGPRTSLQQHKRFGRQNILYVSLICTIRLRFYYQIGIICISFILQSQSALWRRWTRCLFLGWQWQRT